ncbi:hypothetical protein LVB77_08550 [Lysobacter sp. 5GHs7-4]|uniref:hypothetical protein n=1 Tax=Lysobacter sp. 5GHs7-4 TaxID=2904253 RepID=UPI001E62A2B0|nr:hypothetical protein [Lysobacter sp. 5GHs7-4]UHQ24720.1 hypothetical protein LVB77_08550 [Lysobacter sp. 5GHs7-4]
MRRLQGWGGKAVVAVLAMACSGVACAIDSGGAVRAANAWTALMPGDDIQSDYRASRVHIADLNRDGIDEVVYLMTAHCIGANFDCTNEVVVMTPLREADPRFPYPDMPGNPGDDQRRVKATGYAGDVALQVPGEVRALSIVDGHVRVDFEVLRDSKICNRTLEHRQKHPCPEPGPYRWTLSWQPGQLAEAGGAASARSSLKP